MQFVHSPASEALGHVKGMTGFSTGIFKIPTVFTSLLLTAEKWHCICNSKGGSFYLNFSFFRGVESQNSTFLLTTNEEH